MRWFDRVKYVFGIKPKIPQIFNAGLDELREYNRALTKTIDSLRRELDEAKANAEFQHVQALDGFRQFREAKEELEALKKQKGGG